jgi:gamma-glutamyltranspeptidase/glutathione hydrolase
MIDDGLDPQTALERPRWCLEALDIPPAAAAAVDSERRPASAHVLALEEGIPPATVQALEALGHPVRVVGGWQRGLFGDGQIIRRDPASGVLWGGSDPRKDGRTAGF